MVDTLDPPDDPDSAPDPVGLARDALALLVAREPERHPLVVALVAPLGTPLGTVEVLLEGSFARFGYAVEHVHLSDLLDTIPYKPLGDMPDRQDREYYQRRMDAGDRLRSDVGHGSGLAALAVGEVHDRRRESGPVVFILRSLKHPDEEALLRQVYGDAFSLLAVSSPVSERIDALTQTLSLFDNPRSEAQKLIERDEADRDAAEYGQNVRAVFKNADVYLPLARGYDPRRELDRFVDSLFGHPFLTPRPDEEAMRLAAAASFRSAAMGRQVGAALVPSTGTTVVVGTNEVPKPGGGQFWADDEPDFRDFQTGEDPNPVYVRRLLQDTLERLSEHGWLREELSALSGVELLAKATIEDGEPAVLEDARAASLIEFTRCVHAEQAAILNAARAGISTEGSSLYSTTFPCHECAKLIIGAGIVEVQYIEPYPKSLVERLYRDLVDTAPPLTADRGLVAGRVPFRAFQGIAPRRYDVVFAAAARRVGAQAAVFDRPQACPRTGGWAEETIEQRETTAIASMKQLLDDLSAKTSGVKENAADAQPVEVQDAPAEQTVGDENAAGESA